ncbi:MAG: hypothetical protein R3C26_19920 [Calditrichia bacterium]
MWQVSQISRTISGAKLPRDTSAVAAVSSSSRRKTGGVNPCKNGGDLFRSRCTFRCSLIAALR